MHYSHSSETHRTLETKLSFDGENNLFCHEKEAPPLVIVNIWAQNRTSNIQCTHTRAIQHMQIYTYAIKWLFLNYKSTFNMLTNLLRGSLILSMNNTHAFVTCHLLRSSYFFRLLRMAANSLKVSSQNQSFNGSLVFRIRRQSQLIYKRYIGRII